MLRENTFKWNEMYEDLYKITACMEQTFHSYSKEALCKKATIHQVTTMLTTCKNVLFPGHNYLLTKGTDDPSLSLVLGR